MSPAWTLPRASSFTPRLSISPDLNGSQKAHRQQHQVRIQREFRARQWLEFRRWADPDGVQLLHVALLVAGEARGGDAPLPDAAFFVRTFRAQAAWATAARACDGARSCRRLRQHFKLMHRLRSLAVGSAQAIRARIAAADDHHALACSQNSAGIGNVSPSLRRFCCGRNSMAKWMPFNSRPGTCRSRGCSAPPASRMAS